MKQGMAVGTCPRDDLSGDGAAGCTTVVNDGLLAERWSDLLCNETRAEVGGAAGFCRDDADRAIGKALRRAERGDDSNRERA